jgi:hypothetical protein
MPYDILQGNWRLSDEMERLQIEKKSALELQKRKYEDWNDNYELFRNKVKTNRLTQRQAVNIPLMKETVKTLLSKIDDAPDVQWSERSNDEVKTIIYQEIWDQSSKENKLELIDLLDKKNVLLYGLSTKKLNIVKDGVTVSVLDAFDIAYDPLMNPWDIESSRFIIHSNIFKTIREILANPKYSKEGKDDLKIWAETPAGVVQSESSRKLWEKKIERLKAMGVQSNEFSYFAGGDRLVNLTEHYTKRWNPKKEKFEKRVAVYADDKICLYDETLMDCIGVDFWPFVVWSEDPETNDIYPDSVADLVRTPNKVLNIWFSQMIENRTLQNFGMHWFTPSEGYTPQTYTPGPGMMLPAPPGDDINKVIKRVEVGGLDDTMEAINQLTAIVERGTGATAIEKGQPEQGQQTLGEVKILVGTAAARTTAMSKFYRMAWYELACKWDKMMQANAPTFLKLFKTSRSGKIYPKRVYAGDWVSKSGFEPTITSGTEQETEETKGLQRLQFVMAQFPNNPALKRIAQKRELKMLDLTPEEIKEVEEAEKKMEEQAQLQMNQQVAQPKPQQPMQMDTQSQQEGMAALAGAY